MIRKPPADWNRSNDGSVVSTVRTAAAVAKGGAEVARRGQRALGGLMCFLFAAIWIIPAIGSGLDGNLPSFIGISAMTAFAVWCGYRNLAKALKKSD